MNTIKKHVNLWLEDLSNLYDNREVKSLFRITCEDLFGYKFSDFDLNSTETFSENEIDSLKQVLKRLKTGEPLQHIVGFTFFDDLKIHVTEDVLIPRPETEELVYWIKENFKSSQELTVLDWCTGSGCIALSLKKYFPNSKVKAYDISKNAIEISSKNALVNNLSVDFEERNALISFDETFKYDIIVSNPPYIPELDKLEMHPNVLNFDPEIALFVPNSNYLMFYKAIAEFALVHLKDKGELYFEIHERFGQETIDLLKEMGFNSLELRKDLQGKDRMIRAIK